MKLNQYVKTACLSKSIAEKWWNHKCVQVGTISEWWIYNRSFRLVF